MKKLLLFFLSAITIASCSSDNSPAPADEYDRGAILANWADNIIIPSYNNYKAKLAELKTASTNFTAAPDEAKLEVLRAKWLDAYMAYQRVGMFNIGKAEEVQLIKFTNTYPTNTTLITSKINTGDMALEGNGNDVAQGFPALDFLLFGVGQDAEAVVGVYRDFTPAASYKAYLNAVVDRLITLNNAVVNDWENGYKNTFIARTDNTSSGSLNRMVNAFVQYYERDVRTAKVGIPAGKFSTTPLPEKVEGYYSRIYSKQLLLEGLSASRDFFNGRIFNSVNTGPSLGSYLGFLNATGTGNDASVSLRELIDNQFGTAISKVNAMGADLNQQVQTDNTKMLESFDAMQRNVAYMKTDMVSAMSISIDYADTDGD